MASEAVRLTALMDFFKTSVRQLNSSTYGPVHPTCLNPFRPCLFEPVFPF
jgi:hypothetical protein